MKTIKLTKNQETIVDDEDYEYFNQWKWHCSGSGYAVRTINSVGQQLLLHREILNIPNDLYVDHVNGNRLDNRRENLRIASNSQNQANSTKKNTNTSGFKGVSFNKQNKRYTAQITVNRQRIHLGYFEFPEDAARVYDQEALRYFGEYAKTNF